MSAGDAVLQCDRPTSLLAKPIWVSHQHRTAQAPALSPAMSFLLPQPGQPVGSLSRALGYIPQHWEVPQSASHRCRNLELRAQENSPSGLSSAARKPRVSPSPPQPRKGPHSCHPQGHRTHSPGPHAVCSQSSVTCLCPSHNCHTSLAVI